MSLESCAEKSHRTLEDVAKGLDFFSKCSGQPSEGVKLGRYVTNLKGWCIAKGMEEARTDGQRPMRRLFLWSRGNVRITRTRRWQWG